MLSHSVDSLHFIVSFTVQKKPFSFLKSHLSTVGLNSWTTEVLFTKSVSTPISCRALPVFSFGTFNISHQDFKPLGINPTLGDGHVSEFFLLHVDTQCPQHHLL